VLKTRDSAPITIPLVLCLLCHAHPLPDFFFLLIPRSVTIPKHYEPSSYAKILAIPKFAERREIFLHPGWGPFLSSLQGHDDGVSIQFAVGFDGRLDHIEYLAFFVSEDLLPQPRNFHGLGIDSSNTINCHIQAITEYSSLNFKMFLEPKRTKKMDQG
jgi:hypothetical protein